MKDVWQKTFGGLDRAYYMRHFFFGCMFLGLIVFMTVQAGAKASYTAVPFAVICTLLYPYSRFVYEGIVGYVMGNNVFFVNAWVMLFTKYMTMALCWAGALFIAPVGLLYLYWHHSKRTA